MLDPVSDSIPPSTTFDRDAEGVWTLMHQGRCLGWVNCVTDEPKFRALSKVTNAMERFHSLNTAREFLFEQAH